MPVRKTESRIPAHFQPSDLGEAVVSTDGRCTLVSYITSPLVVNRENGYVLFITDETLASSAQTYEWTFTENENTPAVRGTDEGVTFYSPTGTGTLSVMVKVLSAGGTEQARVEMTQSIVQRNAQLEQLITNATEESGPGANNPDVARELINDHNPYYQAVSLQTPEEGNSFKCFVLSTAFDGALRRNPARRKQHIEQIAASLNNNLGDYAELASEGVGVCRIRLALLGMTLGSSPPLPWTEYPEASAEGARADLELRNQLKELDELVRIDLFNLLRFPKSNITQCGKILESLRDRYYSGVSFDDIVRSRRGIRAAWITTQLREGPIQRNGEAPKGKTSKKKQTPPICSLLSIQPGASPGPAPAPPQRYNGTREHVPDQTYIVAPRVANDDFILGAETYHTNCGLQPTRINSIAHMVQLLSAQAARLGRIRVVTHANGDDMLVPLFGETTLRADRHSLKDHIRAFAIDDEKGILSILDLNLGGNFFNWRASRIFNLMRGTPDAALLAPFDLEHTGLPEGTLERFMFYCCDLAYVNDNRVRKNNANLNANGDERSHLIRAVNKLIDLTAPTNPGTAELRTHLTGLRPADLGVPNNDRYNYQMPAGSLNRFLLAGRAADAVEAGFRNQLTIVRGRLDENSTIDIRGCRAGRDTDYLRAVQELFGRENRRPTVTGPNWYQYFGTCNSTVADNNVEIRNLFRAGANAAPNRRAFEDWAERTHVNESHKTFWLNKLDGSEGNVIRFCRMDWRPTIPALFLETPGLAAFNALNFRDAIARTALFFNAPNADTPSGGTLDTINTFVTTKLDGYATFLLADIDETNVAANFTALSQIDDELGTSLIPATAPDPLQVSDIEGFQAALIEHIETNQLQPIREFMEACENRLEDDNNPGINYYMLNIGMPVFLIRDSERVVAGRRVNVINNRIVVHTDFRDSAFRQWPPMLWEEPLPAGNTVSTFDIDTVDHRRFAMMVQTPNPGMSAVATCPHPDYMYQVETISNVSDPLF